MSTYARRRAVALLILAVAVGVGVALLTKGGGQELPGGALAPGRAPGLADDPFGYHPDRRAEFERNAAAGLAHVLYAKSPGGALATAARVARLRPLVNRAVADQPGANDGPVVDADTLEAIVFLESAGRPDARASDDLDAAAGLTQILAQTGRDLLGLRVDVKASERLTRGILRGHKVARREALRRKVDERFDPRKALAATVRYLKIARGHLGRTDLSVVSYHMGIGNLQRALAAYGAGQVPYAQLYFDSTPLRHAKAYDILASLGDDSSTYYWRILAAEQIMREYRRDPAALARTAQLQTQKASAENVLRPAATTPTFSDPFALGRARAAGKLVGLPARALQQHGVRIDPRIGELAGKVHQVPELYRALSPLGIVTLEYIGGAVKRISGDQPLTITSGARDEQYQRVLAEHDIEATHNYSVHTTGYAFDVSRRYVSHRQALAFQFMLDRLTALNVIAWVREPAAIHITVGPRARALLRPKA
jgi:hypothetical protein